MKNSSSLSQFASAVGAKKKYSTSGFGLNPNLTIEDEYVENLLKQIHFMNMEVKLLREKQAQSAGNGLWGVINRANEPLVKNIVDSNQKYQDMRKKATGDLYKIEYDNVCLSEHQSGLVKKLAFLEQKVAQLGTTEKDFLLAAKAKKAKLIENIDRYEAKLRAVEGEKESEMKKQAQLQLSHDSLVSEAEKEKSLQQYEAARIKNDQRIEEAMEKEKVELISELRAKIQTLKEARDQNTEYVKALEVQKAIRENISALKKNIASAEFDMMQTNDAIKLAENQKAKEIIERKRLTEEYETLKIVLKEIASMNQTRKAQEADNCKKQSPEIQKSNYQTKKYERNLEEIKKKIAKSEESQKVLRLEVDCLDRRLSKLKELRLKANDALTKITSENEEKDGILSTCRSQLRRMGDQHEKAAELELNASVELNDVHKQIVQLRERKDCLAERLNLKQALSHTKLEELQKVVQKNKDVNETVGVLLQKWEQIKQFSKM